MNKNTTAKGNEMTQNKPWIGQVFNAKGKVITETTDSYRTKAQALKAAGDLCDTLKADSFGVYEMAR